MFTNHQLHHTSPSHKGFKSRPYNTAKVVTAVYAAHFGRDLVLCPPTVTLAPPPVHAPPEAWAEPT